MAQRKQVKTRVKIFPVWFLRTILLNRDLISGIYWDGFQVSIRQWLLRQLPGTFQNFISENAQYLHSAGTEGSERNRVDTILLDVSEYLARGVPKIFVQSLCICYWDLGNFQTDKSFLAIKETPNMYRRGAKACHEKTA